MLIILTFQHFYMTKSEALTSDFVDSLRGHKIRERLHLMCGGTLEIQSSKESGTLVTSIIPASPNQSSPAVR